MVKSPGTTSKLLVLSIAASRLGSGAASKLGSERMASREARCGKMTPREVRGGQGGLQPAAG